MKRRHDGKLKKLFLAYSYIRRTCKLNNLDIIGMFVVLFWTIVDFLIWAMVSFNCVIWCVVCSFPNNCWCSFLNIGIFKMCYLVYYMLFSEQLLMFFSEQWYLQLCYLVCYMLFSEKLLMIFSETITCPWPPPPNIFFKNNAVPLFFFAKNISGFVKAESYCAPAFVVKISDFFQTFWTFYIFADNLQ